MDTSKLITGLNHIGLPTPDMTATVAFYEKIGFSVLWQTEDKNTSFLKLDSCIIEAYTSDECVLKAGAVDHIALNVTDIEASYEFAKECGFEIIDEEIHFLPFFENGVRYFMFYGPSRERVEFVQKL